MGSNKFIVLTLIVFSATLVSIGLAAAADPQVADVITDTDQGRYDFSDIAADTDIDVTSGNVKFTELESNQSTVHWAALYGNVTGNIVLGDSSENVLYDWATEGRLVYASESAAPTWAALVDASQANVVGELPYLGRSTGDNYTNTFNWTTAENISSLLFQSITSDYAMTYNSTKAHTWKTYSLWDTTNLVFAARVSPDGDSYVGSAVDFQMLLPEDGEEQDETATTYNLWVELI